MSVPVRTFVQILVLLSLHNNLLPKTTPEVNPWYIYRNCTTGSPKGAAAHVYYVDETDMTQQDGIFHRERKQISNQVTGYRMCDKQCAAHGAQCLPAGAERELSAPLFVQFCWKMICLSTLCPAPTERGCSLPTQISSLPEPAIRDAGLSQTRAYPELAVHAHYTKTGVVLMVLDIPMVYRIPSNIIHTAWIIISAVYHIPDVVISVVPAIMEKRLSAFILPLLYKIKPCCLS